MYIDFHADDMTAQGKGANMPNLNTLNGARQLVNCDSVIPKLAPRAAFLKYTGQVKKPGFPWIFGWGEKITDTWKLIAGKVESATIKIPSGSQDYGEIAEQLMTAAKEVSRKSRYKIKEYRIFSTVVRVATRT